jgi:hypothetical protein
VFLASKDETPKDVKDFEANLKVPKYVETFPTQIQRQLHPFLFCLRVLVEELENSLVSALVLLAHLGVEGS